MQMELFHGFLIKISPYVIASFVNKLMKRPICKKNLHISFFRATDFVIVKSV